MARSNLWNAVAALAAALVVMTLLSMSIPRQYINTRVNQCAARLKCIGLATIQHDVGRAHLPGYIEDFGTYSGDGSDRTDPANHGVPRHKKLGTWAVALLPWLDAQPTYEHWTQDRYPVATISTALGKLDEASGTGLHPLAAPNLAIFQCPSNPVTRGNFGKNSMVYNNGLARSPNQPLVGISHNINDGVGNSKYNVTKINPATGEGTHSSEGPNIGLDDFTDGKNCTILFSENIQALPWHRAGLIHSVDLIMEAPHQKDVKFNLNMPQAFAAQYTQGMVWHYEDAEAANPKLSHRWNKLGTTAPVTPKNVAPVHRINGCLNGDKNSLFNLRIDDAVTATDYARPSSAHNTGVNVVFADGSTRFINETIDYRVYQELMTPCGKKSSIPFRQTILSAEFRK